MAVTRTFAAGPEQFFQQIDQIIKSHSLRGSESLCKLLQYLAKQSLYHPDAPLKEYQIATEVYGRPRGLRSPVRLHDPRAGRAASPEIG